MRTVIGFLIFGGFLFNYSFASAQGVATAPAAGRTMEEVMEQMRTTNPEAYAQMQDAMERQKKISQIVSDYRAGKVSREEAQEAISPLIKENVDKELPSLDFQIEQMKEYIKILEEAKTNPEVLVKKRIEQMLGQMPAGSSPVSPESGE